MSQEPNPFPPEKRNVPLSDWADVLMLAIKVFSLGHFVSFSCFILASLYLFLLDGSESEIFQF